MITALPLFSQCILSISCQKGKTYILVMPFDTYGQCIHLASGKSGGSYTIAGGLNVSGRLEPLAFKRHDVLRTSTMVINVTDDIGVYGCCRFPQSSLIEIPELGNRYMIHSTTYCEIVIVSHTDNTQVNITGMFSYDGNRYDDVEDGHPLVVTLDIYQEIVLDLVYYNNITQPMIINSSHTIAVFHLYWFEIFGERYMREFEQILPVRHYGLEYVVASFGTDNDLLINTEYENTRIQFSNGTVVHVNKSDPYFQHLPNIYYFSFKADKPIAAKLKVVGGDSITIPPVSSYVTECILASHNPRWVSNVTVKILAGSTTSVLVTTAASPSVAVDWTDIPDTQYKVGTHVVPAETSTLYTSNNGRFTVLVNGGYNCGYNFTDNCIHCHDPASSDVQ